MAETRRILTAKDAQELASIEAAQELAESLTELGPDIVRLGRLSKETKTIRSDVQVYGPGQAPRVKVTR